MYSFSLQVDNASNHILTKEAQLNDEQSNLSSIHTCHSAEKTPSKETIEEESAAVIVKDYSAYANLEGPPRIGDTIAFKVWCILSTGYTYII